MPHGIGRLFNHKPSRFDRLKNLACQGRSRAGADSAVWFAMTDPSRLAHTARTDPVFDTPGLAVHDQLPLFAQRDQQLA